MSFAPPNQKKQKGPITEDLDIALENWQYWVYGEWLGDNPEEQDQRANLIYEVIKKHDNNATVQRRPGKDNKGVVYTFTVSLYGNPEDVLKDINEIQSILLKFTDNYKVRAGEAYAWVQGMESSKMVPASVGESTDMTDAISSLLDSVYGIKQTSQPSPNQSTPPSNLSVTENNLEKKDNIDDATENFIKGNIEYAKRHIQQGIDFLNQVDDIISKQGSISIGLLQIIQLLSRTAKGALERYYEGGWDKYDTQGEIPIMYEDFIKRVNKILSSVGYKQENENEYDDSDCPWCSEPVTELIAHINKKHIHEPGAKEFVHELENNFYIDDELEGPYRPCPFCDKVFDEPINLTKSLRELADHIKKKHGHEPDAEEWIRELLTYKKEETNEENLSPYPRYYSPYDPNVRGDNQSWLPEHISINSIPATHNPPLPPRQASPWDTGITNENISTSGNDFTDNKRRVDSNYGY